MNPDPNRPRRDRDPDDPPASPYGPQPRGADEAAGGADSSPHETQSSGERAKQAEAGRRGKRNPDPGGDINETP